MGTCWLSPSRILSRLGQDDWPPKFEHLCACGARVCTRLYAGIRLFAGTSPVGACRHEAAPWRVHRTGAFAVAAGLGDHRREDVGGLPCVIGKDGRAALGHVRRRCQRSSGGALTLTRRNGRRTVNRDRALRADYEGGGDIDAGGVEEPGLDRLGGRGAAAGILAGAHLDLRETGDADAVAGGLCE